MDYQKDLWKYFTILVQKQLTGRGTCILKKVISTLRVEDTHTGTFCWSTNVTATLVHDTLLNFKLDHSPHVKKK